MLNENIAHGALVTAVVGAAYLALSVAAPTSAQTAKPAVEKCYGISKAGENSCAAANGSHGCAGQSKTAFSGQTFKEVPAGSCAAMKGEAKPFEGVNAKMKG
jgi:uncharacterized membrane protein